MLPAGPVDQSSSNMACQIVFVALWHCASARATTGCCLTAAMQASPPPPTTATFPSLLPRTHSCHPPPAHTHIVSPQVAAAKDVAAFAGKYKEAKRCRAYEAYQHLAAAVTFGSSGSNGGSSSAFDQLLQLVRDKLPSAGSPTVRAKLEQLLTAAARGLAQNPSVTPQTLAAWIGVQLDACLRVEEAARAKAKGAAGAAVSTAATAAAKRGAAAAAADTAEEEEAAAAAAAAAGVGGDGSAHLYLLSHFYLMVLSSSLKKGLLSGSSREVLLLLDPLLPLLVRGLGSRHMGTVQVRMRQGLAVRGAFRGFWLKLM